MVIHRMQKQAAIALLLIVLVAFSVCKMCSGMGDAPQPAITLAELTEPECRGGIRLSLDFPTASPLNGVCVVSRSPQETYPQPPITEGCTFTIATEEGKLKAVLPDTPGATCNAKEERVIHRRQPDGSIHPLRHILLSCTMQTPAGDELTYLLQLELDIIAHTADLTVCTAVPTEPQPDGAHVQHYHSLVSADLPEKHRGSPTQRRMSMLVYATAAVNSPELAQGGAQELLAFAWNLAREVPRPADPWPECWGEHADDARAAAALITPTLIYLQEKNCFECGDLAAYINSPAFGIIFGDRFRAPTAERLQTEPIPIIRVQPHEE